MPAARPLLIGHRGASGYRPEHSRSAYALAFELGADAVEPDIVFSKDGEAVIRHENEISSTTDVADRPEFASRRTTKVIDGEELTGWFTEDFTWAELSTLRCRERLPALRPASASFDDTGRILRLSDLVDLLRQASVDHGRELGMVLEIKHATYFDALGFDVAGRIAASLEASRWHTSGLPLWIESFEWAVLQQLQALGVAASYIFLMEATGSPYDLRARQGERAPSYADLVTGGMDALAGRVDGISVDKSMILAPGADGRVHGPTSVVADAHRRGLRVFTWTLRPENAFLAPEFRGAGGAAEHGDFLSEWQIITESGVDGVFVDHPDLWPEAQRAPRA